MILLIAYGNPLRQDDGAGLILADRIERIWQRQNRRFRRIDTHQLTPELAQDIAAAEISGVVFCDACVSEQTPGCGPALQVHALSSEAQPSPALGHHLTPNTVLFYADRLYDKRPPAWVITVPGVDFGYGERLSDSVQRALDGVQNILENMFVC